MTLYIATLSIDDHQSSVRPSDQHFDDTLTFTHCSFSMKFINLIVSSALGIRVRGFQFQQSHGYPLNLKPYKNGSRPYQGRPRNFINNNFNADDWKIFPLSMTSQEPEAVEAEIVVDSTPALQMEQKTQAAAYRTSSILYLALALDALKRKSDILIFGGATNNLNTVSPVSMGAGFVIAAVSSHCLIGATEHNRLTSDTYKRINLALSAFSFMNFICHMISWPFLGGAACFCSAYNMKVAISGWTKGIKGLGRDKGRSLSRESYMSELEYGLRETWKGAITFKSKEAVGYFISLSMATIVVLHNVIIVPILWQKSLARVNAIRIASTSRLVLVSSLIFTLMDAANRQRLKGSTFIKLNCALAAGSMTGKD